MSSRRPQHHHRPMHRQALHSLQRMPSSRPLSSSSPCFPRRLIIVQFLVTCLVLLTSVRSEARDEIPSGTIVVSDADTDRKILQETTNALFGARTPSSHRQAKSLTLDQELEESASSQSLVTKDLDPLQSILPKVTFVCKGLREGYYADTGFDCEVFHYCKTNGFRFTFVCPTGSKFNQRQMTCDYDAKDSICTDVSVKRKDSQSTSSSYTTSKTTTTASPTITTTTTTTTAGTTSPPESSEAERQEEEQEVKLSHSLISSIPGVDDWIVSHRHDKNKKTQGLNSLWPHFDSQSLESHSRPVIHDTSRHQQELNWKNNESPVPESRLTTSSSSSKSYFEEPDILYLNASNVDASDFAASQAETGVHRTQSVYQFTGTSVSDRYVSPLNTQKSVVRSTTPMPSIDPQPVYQPDSSPSSSTTTTTTTVSPATIGTSTSSGPTAEPSFFGSSSDERRTSVKPPYGYRNPYSFKPLPPVTVKVPASDLLDDNNNSTDSTSTTTTTTTSRSPIQKAMQELLIAATATPVPQSTTEPTTISSFTWNQEMTGSGFKPVKQAVHSQKYQSVENERYKDSSSNMMFSGDDIMHLPSRQPFFPLTPSSSPDTGFEAVFPDSSLSAARLHELLTGASHAALIAGTRGTSPGAGSSSQSLHHLLSSPGDPIVTMGGTSLENPFPTQPLILQSMTSEHHSSPHQHQHHQQQVLSSAGSGSQWANFSIPASSSPSPGDHNHQELVYETVTISHSGVNPFTGSHAGDSLSPGIKNLLLEQSSPANPAFLTGFRQYHTPHFASLSALNHRRPNFQPKVTQQPVQQQQLLSSPPFGLMTHLLPGTTVHRLPPSIPLTGSQSSLKYSGTKDSTHKSSYLYLNRGPTHEINQLNGSSITGSSHHTPRGPTTMTTSVSSQGMMHEFQQLPSSIQHMIAKQLGLTPPPTTPSHKFPFPVTQSLGQEDGTSEDTGFKTKGRIFGLPKLKPMTLNPGMEHQTPHHNFHTQNPHLLPNAILVSGSNLTPVSKPNRPLTQVNHQPASPQPAGQGTGQPVLSSSSIMTEINNLLKQNIFTRPRTLSLRPPVGQDKHTVPVLKITSNPFTSWLKPSAGVSNQISDHSGIPFAMMTSGSQSSYPSFADPPNFMQSPDTRPKRKFFFSRPFFPFSHKKR